MTTKLTMLDHCAVARVRIFPELTAMVELLT